MAKIGWVGPFSFTLKEGERGIGWYTYTDYDEDGEDNQFTNEAHHYELIDGKNSSILELVGSSVRIKESFLQNYKGFESGPNYFDFTIKTTTTFHVGFERFDVVGYHKFDFSITDIPPGATPEANLESGAVSETAKVGDIVKYNSSGLFGLPYAFSDNRFTDGTGKPTVVLRDNAGGRFRLDHVNDEYVLKVASTDLLDADLGTQYKLAVDISDGTTTVTNYINVDIWNAAPQNLRNVGGTATVNEHAAVGTAVGFTARADEPKSGAVTYSISGDRPFGLAIDAQTGVVRVSDSSALDFERFSHTDGKLTFQVTATDALGGFTTSDFSITLRDINDAPRFYEFAEKDFTFRENGTDVVGTLRATDQDQRPERDVVTHTLSGADASKFIIDATTGDIRFKTAPDFDTRADADRDNVYAFNVVASDGTTSTRQAVTVALTDVDEAPVIAGGATKSLSVVEGTSPSTILYRVAATDLDSDSLQYGIVGSFDAFSFEMDASGNLRFRFPPDYDHPDDQGQNHVYDISVYAWDGTNRTTQDIKVTVTETPENRAPVIGSNGGGTTASVSIKENAKGVTTVKATDADAGSTLTYALVGGADRSLFAIDAQSGVLTFKTAPDFETRTDADRNGIYQVNVGVSDGAKTDAQALSVKVLDVAGITRSGSSGPDPMTGTIESDKLSGLGGNDTIKGFGGYDTLTGGTGADKLYGGIDVVRDTFVFAKGDSGSAKLGATTWDAIYDFKSGIDKIDLSKIDADAYLAGTQDLRFVTAFKKAVAKDSVADGQYRLVDDGSHYKVEIDVNGDTAADMVIRVMNVASLKAAASGDFLF